MTLEELRRRAVQEVTSTTGCSECQSRLSENVDVKLMMLSLTGALDIVAHVLRTTEREIVHTDGRRLTPEAVSQIAEDARRGLGWDGGSLTSVERWSMRVRGDA